jgi:hypothetical protein
MHLHTTFKEFAKNLVATRGLHVIVSDEDDVATERFINALAAGATGPAMHFSRRRDDVSAPPSRPIPMGWLRFSACDDPGVVALSCTGALEGGAVAVLDDCFGPRWEGAAERIRAMSERADELGCALVMRFRDVRSVVRMHRPPDVAVVAGSISDDDARSFFGAIPALRIPACATLRGTSRSKALAAVGGQLRVVEMDEPAFGGRERRLATGPGHPVVRCGGVYAVVGKTRGCRIALAERMARWLGLLPPRILAVSDREGHLAATQAIAMEGGRFALMVEADVGPQWTAAVARAGATVFMLRDEIPSQREASFERCFMLGRRGCRWEAMRRVAAFLPNDRTRAEIADALLNLDRSGGWCLVLTVADGARGARLEAMPTDCFAREANEVCGFDSPGVSENDQRCFVTMSNPRKVDFSRARSGGQWANVGGEHEGKDGGNVDYARIGGEREEAPSSAGRRCPVETNIPRDAAFNRDAADDEWAGKEGDERISLLDQHCFVALANPRKVDFDHKKTDGGGEEEEEEEKEDEGQICSLDRHCFVALSNPRKVDFKAATGVRGETEEPPSPSRDVGSSLSSTKPREIDFYHGKTDGEEEEEDDDDDDEGHVCSLDRRCFIALSNSRKVELQAAAGASGEREEPTPPSHGSMASPVLPEGPRDVEVEEALTLIFGEREVVLPAALSMSLRVDFECGKVKRFEIVGAFQ